MVSLLLAHGAHPFLSTQMKDSLCYSASAQRGCYSPISVAAAHGQRLVLQKLLSQPMAPINKEVLSLEEMLAEGTVTNRSSPVNSPPQFSKMQIKALQVRLLVPVSNYRKHVHYVCVNEDNKSIYTIIVGLKSNATCKRNFLMFM